MTAGDRVQLVESRLAGEELANDWGRVGRRACNVPIVPARGYLELDLRRGGDGARPPFADGAAGVRVRLMDDADTAELGRLMVDAYRGTIDYEGESAAEAEAEIARVAGGSYGEPLRDVCLVAVATSGRLVSALLCTRRRGVPFVCFIFTHPDLARQGIAGRLVREASSRLAGTGEHALGLWVTFENPARLLYERLGFRAVEEPAED